jgi:transcriptional regulator with XRE-family HTH domain
MTIGVRLREERERLDLSQPKFAAVAGTTKQTLFSWESGKTAPDAFQLAQLAGIGADVLYVVTGLRSGGVTPPPALRDGEATLLEGYRALDARGKAGVMALIAGMGAPAAPAAPRKLVQTSHGDSGVQYGYVGSINHVPTPQVPAKGRRK